MAQFLLPSFHATSVDVRVIGSNACFRREEPGGSDVLVADRAAVIVFSRHAASTVVTTRRIAGVPIDFHWFMKGLMRASTYVPVNVGSALAFCATTRRHGQPQLGR